MRSKWSGVTVLKFSDGKVDLARNHVNCLLAYWRVAVVTSSAQVARSIFPSSSAVISRAAGQAGFDGGGNAGVEILAVAGEHESA